MVVASETFDIEAVRREWVGASGPVVPGRYPVEHDPIRRYCHMIEDDNPMFLDPEHAASTRFGGVIAPPGMLDYFAGHGAWPRSAPDRLVQQVPTRGSRFINLSQVLEFHRPARVGDRLSAQMVIEDIIEKGIRLDPKAVWITFAIHVTNQDGELVSVTRNTLLTHRDPAAVAADAATGSED